MAIASDDLLTDLNDPLHEAIATASVSVLLCSPFIGPEVAVTLAGVAGGEEHVDWRLLTVLSPRAVAYGSLAIDGLRALQDAGVALRHLPALHAKLFLIDDAVAFVGSANLTSSGLGTEARRNHELTVRLNGEQRRSARQQFDAWWTAAADVTPAMLNTCERAARNVEVTFAGEPAEADPGLVADVEALLADAQGVQSWIKAEYRDEITADTPRSSMPWVASPGPGKPRFARGDLLLIYAKGAKKCNAVVEVEGPTSRDPDFLSAHGISDENAARWPWVTHVVPRLQVPIADGVPLARLGLVGQSLQPGHRRMPIGGLATALRYMCRLQTADE